MAMIDIHISTDIFKAYVHIYQAVSHIEIFLNDTVYGFMFYFKTNHIFLLPVTNIPNFV